MRAKLLENGWDKKVLFSDKLYVDLLTPIRIFYLGKKRNLRAHVSLVKIHTQSIFAIVYNMFRFRK